MKVLSPIGPRVVRWGAEGSPLGLISKSRDTTASVNPQIKPSKSNRQKAKLKTNYLPQESFKLLVNDAILRTSIFVTCC
jgi:hypothetical protein